MRRLSERAPRAPLSSSALLLLCLASTSPALVAGCAHVAPWDRAELAHPTMTTSDLMRPAEEHVRAVQEGAQGGGFAAGGGCGCN